jgi:hypothetical protein
MYMRFRIMVMLVVCSFAVWGCPAVPTIKPVSLPPSPEISLAKVKIQDLTGEWKYEEGRVIYPLTLDEEGRGTYKWKEGRFETTNLSNGVWKGTWHQEGNDREGGFELQLHPDLQSATGSWWYTRIETDQDPLEPGGSFSLRRVKSGS